MAGVDAVYEAAFQRAGMVRVYHAEDMFDCAELLARHRTPAGPRLAVITNAGGPGVMAIDELLDHHGQVAELTPATIARLDSELPPHWSHRNPVDLLGDARPERFAQALGVVAAIPMSMGRGGVDPQAMTGPIGTAIALPKSGPANKPVLQRDGRACCRARTADPQPSLHSHV
jgi:acetyltransferase